MEWWQVYLFTRLDSLSFLCTLTVIVGGIFLAAAACIGLMEFESFSKFPSACKHWFKVTATVWVAACVAGLVIPTQKEAAAIYLLPKLTHSDFAKEAQRIPADTAKFMRLKLEAWIADMEPKSKK